MASSRRGRGAAGPTRGSGTNDEAAKERTRAPATRRARAAALEPLALVDRLPGLGPAARGGASPSTGSAPSRTSSGRCRRAGTTSARRARSRTSSLPPLPDRSERRSPRRWRARRSSRSGAGGACASCCATPPTPRANCTRSGSSARTASCAREAGRGRAGDRARDRAAEEAAANGPPRPRARLARGARRASALPAARCERRAREEGDRARGHGADRRGWRACRCRSDARRNRDARGQGPGFSAPQERPRDDGRAPGRRQSARLRRAPRVGGGVHARVGAAPRGGRARRCACARASSPCQTSCRGSRTRSASR